MQLENFGVNIVELKKPAIHRIFRAWIEDWEKDLLLQNDCVAEARLLEKYKDLVFYDIDNDKNCRVWDKNLQFYRKNTRLGIDAGWAVVCMNDEGEEFSWYINEHLCELIGSNQQAVGIEVIRQEVVEVRSEEEAKE